MTNAIIECIVSRSTTKKYDPAVTLSDVQIHELVRIATTAQNILPHAELALHRRAHA